MGYDFGKVLGKTLWFLLSCYRYDLFIISGGYSNEVLHACTGAPTFDYQIDLKYLYDFCNNCSIKDKIVPENKEDQHELDGALLDALLKSYKIIDLKLYSKVRKELEKVHA